MRFSLRTVLIGLLAACAGLIRGDSLRQGYTDLAYPHEPLLYEPSLRSQPREIAHEPSAVPFGEFVSIQVNTNEFGCDFLGDAATETTIAVDPNDPRRMVIGWRQFDSDASGFREAGVAYSHDGGRTWVNDGPVRNDLFGSDPVLAVDSGGVFYYSSIDFEQLRLYRSFDGGRTWPSETVAFEGFFDKPWMAIAGGELRDSPAVVICRAGMCVVSSDGGGTFGDPISVEFLGLPHVISSATGREIYLVGGHRLENGFLPETDFTLTRMGAAVPKPRSITPIGGTNLGGSLSASGFMTEGLTGTPWVALDPALDAVYVFGTVRVRGNRVVMCPLSELAVRFTRSLDGGRTWSDPIGINDEALAPPIFQWFGTMATAPSGRIDTIWAESQNDGECDFPGSQIIYSSSDDAGHAWAPNAPVSPPFEYIQDPSLKLGDYYHMHSDNLGANLAYAGTFTGAPDIYFLRIGPWDCNGNEIDDAADISGGASLDVNGNDVPDECEFRGDADGDDLTTLLDLADLQACFTGDGGTFAGGIATTVDADGLTPSGGDPLSEGILYTNPACALFDLEPDGDVDLIDTERILAVMQGPGFSCR